MEQELQQPLNPPIEERKLSFFKQHKFTLISVAILILALIPLILLTQMQKKSTPTSITVTTPTPTTTPLTQDNAQPTLDQAAQNVQTALDESQSDLNAAAQVNTSADSTAGL